RAKETQYTPGGKGINVTKVVNQYKEDVCATGFLGGRAGDYIIESLDNLSIENKFTSISGETRSCISILSEDSQTEVLEGGPEISEKEFDSFIGGYKDLIKDTEYIAASGSLPKGLESNTYKKLIEIANKKGKKFLLDTSGEALEKGIEGKPFLIKPNEDELAALLGKAIENEEDLVNGGKSLLDKGTEIVVISLGSEGSLVFNDNTMYKVSIPQVEVINPVGLGDAMVAGFLVGLKRGYDIEKLIKFASDSGTLNAMEAETGKVNPSKVEEIMKKINIESEKL